MVWSENPTPIMTIKYTNYLVVRCIYHFYHTLPDTNIHMFLCQYYSAISRGLAIMGIFADFQLVIILPVPFNLKQV